GRRVAHVARSPLPFGRAHGRGDRARRGRVGHRLVPRRGPKLGRERALVRPVTTRAASAMLRAGRPRLCPSSRLLPPPPTPRSASLTCALAAATPCWWTWWSWQ